MEEQPKTEIQTTQTPREQIKTRIRSFYKDNVKNESGLQEIETAALDLYEKADLYHEVQLHAHEEAIRLAGNSDWQSAQAATSVSRYFDEQRTGILKELWDWGALPGQRMSHGDVDSLKDFRYFQQLPPALNTDVLMPKKS